MSGDTGVKVEGLSWEHSKTIGVSHPIGVDYNNAVSRKRQLFLLRRLLTALRWKMIFVTVVCPAARLTG